MHRGDWLDKPWYLYLQLFHRQTHSSDRLKLGCHAQSQGIGRGFLVFIAFVTDAPLAPLLGTPRWRHGDLVDLVLETLSVLHSSLCGRTISICLVQRTSGGV